MSSICNSTSPLNSDTKTAIEKEDEGPNKRRGFKNLGNTCYLSSVVVALSSIPKIVATINEYNDWLTANSTLVVQRDQAKRVQFIQELSNLLVGFRNSRIAPSARRLHQMTGKMDLNFKNYLPQDAHEFLGLVTSAAEMCADIQDNIDGRDKSNSLFPKFPMFFTMRSRVECSICKTVADSKEEALGLSVDVNESDSDWWILDTWEEEEDMTDENQFQCNKCRKKVDAVRRTRPLTLPDCLVIHYKLFEASMVSESVVFNKCYPAPLPPRFIHFSEIPMVQSNKDSNEVYFLKAIVFHDGPALDEGHYVCVVRIHENCWRVYNDEKVFYVDWNSICNARRSTTPYLMFYQKTAAKNCKNRAT
ncbi:USP domain-containing protein [Aphelenchoides besseyi]|nr:USP domain-containing protein [Aphelenchoides besseyi]